MQLTIVSENSQKEIFIVIVTPDTSILSLKHKIEKDANVSVEKQQLYFNQERIEDDNKTLEGAKIKDGDLIRVLSHEVLAIPQTGLQSQPRSAEAERLRLTALERPNVLDQIKRQQPGLAAVINDPQLFSTKWLSILNAQKELDLAQARLNDDPFDVEAQKKIEEMIRKERVQLNLNEALENIPESFTRGHMLYVPVIVNGERIKAFVDSGAQATIMSPDCAKKCNIWHLLDTSFSGMAKGVGTAKILGRVHVAVLSIGGVALHCSFTVMEGKDVDLLLGLDMLRRHTACINLKRNVLEIADKEVPFLHESEIPKQDMAVEEPLVDGPGGSKIGGISGAIIPPSEAQPASSSSSQLPPAQPAPAAAPLQTPSVAAVSREAIDSVVSVSGASEQEAISALQASGGNVDAAVGMFFGN